MSEQNQAIPNRDSKDLQIEKLEHENNLLKLELSDLKEDLHVFAIANSDWYKDVRKSFYNAVDDDDLEKAKQAFDLILTKIPYNHQELAVIRFHYDLLVVRLS